MGMRTAGEFTYLTAAEMAEVDRSAIEDFGVDVISLMENAGLGAANVARRMLGGDVSGERIVCLVGKGNNGGDGLVAARRLHDWGADVAVVLCCPADELRDVPARQLVPVQRQGVAVSGPGMTSVRGSLIIDALLGYNARGDPRGPVGDLIRVAVDSGVRALAVDVPSGLDASTGTPGNPCVVAEATVTFGLPKTGFLNPDSRKYVGELYLADISLPRQLYLKLPSVPVAFPEGGLARVDRQGF